MMEMYFVLGGLCLLIVLGSAVVLTYGIIDRLDSDDSDENNTLLLVLFSCLIIIFSIFAGSAFYNAGQCRVKSKTPPVVEYTIREHFDGNEVKRDTTYIYRFR